MQSPELHPWQPYPALTDDERIARARAFRHAMASRRSCRAFSEQPVPREVIQAAIEGAASAPSGANQQPWHFCAVESPEAKAAIRVAVEEEERHFYGGRAAGEWVEAVRPLGTTSAKPYLETAPWLIVAFGQRRERLDAKAMRQNYHVAESVGIACGMLLTALHQAGLATLVHPADPARFFNRVCRRPEDEKPMLLIVVGHPAPDATVPAHALNKKPLEQILSWL
jgi:iodotyrosine deiodinase